MMSQIFLEIVGYSLAQEGYQILPLQMVKKIAKKLKEVPDHHGCNDARKWMEWKHENIRKSRIKYRTYYFLTARSEYSQVVWF
jgi:hypothetical protein